MKTIAELRSELSQVLTDASDLCKAVKSSKGDTLRDFTSDEEKSHDEYLVRADELKTEIEKREATESRVAKTQEGLASLEGMQERKVTPAAGAVSDAPKTETREEAPKFEVRLRYGKLHAFKGNAAEERAYRAGRWVHGMLFGDQRSAEWCREQGIVDGYGLVRAAQAEGVNARGGALVPDEFSSAIIDLREDFGEFRKQTRIMPMASDTLIMPRRTGGPSATFFGENTELSEGNATWDNVQLVAKKLGILVKYSKEVAEDAFVDIADLLAQEIAYQFALKEDDCGFTGDGTSTDGGITGIVKKFEDDETLVGAVTAASGNDTFAEITNNDLTSVMGTLPKYARRNAKWYVSSQGKDLMMGRLQAAAGGNTIQTLNGDFGSSYLGAPVVEVQTLPTTTGDLSEKVMALYGDLSQSSTMGDRRDIRLQIANERYIEFDQVGIMATERFDIVNHDFGDTSEAGPIVALIGD